MMLTIDENTKVVARFYPSANNRGLNIYNPYFQDTGVNAVYILFHNPNPKILLDGMRSLNLSGAIVAGSFEGDPRIPDYIDDLHPLSRIVNRVGMLVNDNGKVWGVYQGAFGLMESLNRLTKIKDKSIVVLGAGTVVRGLLGLMHLSNNKPKQISLYNRTVEKADTLAHEFPFVSKVSPISELITTSEGDIFINATNIGSPWNKGDNFVFPDQFVNKFDYIVDVTFVPLAPQLIQTAQKLGKKHSPGHRMFLFQGKYAFENILKIKIDEEKLSEKMIRDFEVNWS